MKRVIPRVLIAGTGSGCGKTTVVSSLLSALAMRKKEPAAFKCGPDYIDPMFHRRITGRVCASLDPYFFDRAVLRGVLAEYASGQINVIEGVMGYYDGIGMTAAASTYEVAKSTETPVVLVIRAKGAAHSILAIIKGFAELYRDAGVKGVILNGCPAALYEKLAAMIREHFGGRIRPLGYLPSIPDASLASRHLGLVTAQEIGDFDQRIALLGRTAAETLDLEGICELADEAPALTAERMENDAQHGGSVRIAVARDEAFCFYYEDSLDVLRKMGAELIPFSPLRDRALPEGVSGLCLGGGYPELYAERLRDNTSMRASVRAAVQGHLPTIAECGGFMYLTEEIDGVEMAGALCGKCEKKERLVRFGYVELSAKRDNLLCAAGECIRAHEFHYYDCTDNGDAFCAKRPSGAGWECCEATDTLYAGFPHIHFRANPEFARHFIHACMREKNRQ